MSEATYYFNSYTPAECWGYQPGEIVDNNLSNFARASVTGDIALVDGNTCAGTNLGSISKVEIRIYALRTMNVGNSITVRPVFSGTSDGDNHVVTISTSGEWSSYVDITSDTNAPGTWAWSNIQNLDCDLESTVVTGYVDCAKVEIRVTYTAPTPTLTLSTAALTGFTYVQGSGPSTEQSYNISGTALNLTDVTITPPPVGAIMPSNWQISLTSGSGFTTNPITLSSYDGTLTTIYVRLKNALLAGTYNNQAITNAGGGASTVNVTCSGEVTAAPVTGGTLTINSKYWG